MLKRILAFLIFFTLAAPAALADTCPATTSPSLNLQISALYPTPNTGEHEWIELTNTGATSVDLSNYTLEDATAHPWTPSGTLSAGSRTQLSGFSFALNTTNETVTLKTVGGTVVDTWTYATSTKGEILYRNATTAPDAPAETPTPSVTAPVAVTPPQWPDFSEALPNPVGSDGDSEWIELYNSYADPLTLDGLQLDDEDGGSTPYALSGTLDGESYLLVSITDSHLTLNNTEDHVRLLGVSGEILWDVPYSGVVEGDSYALVNGENVWTDNPTPGEENADPTLPATLPATADQPDPAQNGDLSDNVNISEVFPNPSGPDTTGEWIELTNNGATSVDLGNWTVQDASGTSYTFPQSTLIGPGETLVLTRTDTGISLNNTSETVDLTDYTGETVSEVSYANAEEDKSYADIKVEEVSSAQASTSGLGNPSYNTWQWVAPSPGAKNPIWKQIKGAVTEWNGQSLILNDGLSQWTLQGDNTDENKVLFQTGNQILVEAAMTNGVYQIMHSELVQSGSRSGGSFPWSWALSGLAALGWIGYELHKKRKKALFLGPQALN